MGKQFGRVNDSPELLNEALKLLSSLVSMCLERRGVRSGVCGLCETLFVRGFMTFVLWLRRLRRMRWSLSPCGSRMQAFSFCRVVESEYVFVKENFLSGIRLRSRIQE